MALSANRNCLFSTNRWPASALAGTVESPNSSASQKSVTILLVEHDYGMSFFPGRPGDRPGLRGKHRDRQP